ncbi:GDP/GTP exchange factor for ARF [Clydaea vesicula]|uniref:GDP/GTP exchange factor for ARF n=1 Tax=Clydaea vesicula TaxID=447962 RepID=A0AAD5Y366_9FUNG|nr:GDP/GTP exchange factor for ARF [Clydaea vesicula]
MNETSYLITHPSQLTGLGDGRVVGLPLSKQNKPELKWLSIVHAEIIMVTSAMRKNQRWNGGNNNGYNPNFSDSDYGHSTAKIKKENQPDYDYFLSASDGKSGLDSVLEYTAGKSDAFLGTTEPPLLFGFTKLKARLTLLNDLRDLEPMHLLEPFLEVIKSGNTTGPITGTALSSVEKFLKYRILDPNHPQLPVAMSALAHSVTHCKFEATDAISDEVVLAKILRLLRVAVTSEAGQKSLDDKGICEMVEAAFGMCFQGRLNELLRRSAEQTLVILVQALFERLTLIMRDKENLDRVKELERSSELARKLKRSSMTTVNDVNIEEKKKNFSTVIVTEDILVNEKNKATSPSHATSPIITLDTDETPNHVSVHQDTPENTLISVSNSERAIADIDFRHNEDITATSVYSNANATDSITEDIQKSHSLTEADDSTKTFEPFGLPAILELIRVLVSLIDPKNKQHTDTMHRRVSVALMGIAVEVGGSSLSKWIAWGSSVEEKRKKAFKGNSKAKKPASNGVTTKEEFSGVHVDIAPNPNGDIRRRSVLVSGEDAVEKVVDVDNLSDLGSMGQVLVTPEVESATEKIFTPEKPQPDMDVKDKVPADYSIQSPETDEERMSLVVKDLITNELCKYLFQILQISNFTLHSPPSSATLNLLGLTLKLITALLQTCREHLKLQQEWLLDWIMMRLDSGVVGWDVEEGYIGDGNMNDGGYGNPHEKLISNKGGVVVGEVRDLLLECISQLVRIPNFMADLYVYFDGDLSCQSHLFENLVRFLSKHVFPDATPGGPVTTLSHQLLCLDSLLVFLKQIVDKIHFGRDTAICGDTTIAEKYSVNKKRKRLLMEGAERFNQNPNEGINFLQTHGFLPTPVDPKSLAYVLKNTPKISKALLGDYISKRDNIEILKAFISDFEFKGKRIDEALRLMLESFRLPGESALIERIMEVFAETYHKSIKDDEKCEIKTQDATFILSYSVIMLNTDQHNPQVRRRMTLEEFRKNNGGVNDGENFDPEYMKTIYQEIKENEIIMPEEHEGDLGFNYAWRELLKKSSTVGRMIETKSNILSKDIFMTVWWPVLAAISYSFDNAEDSLTLQKAIVGFHHCAVIAAHYQQIEVLDSIIISLSKISGLLKESQTHSEKSNDIFYNEVFGDQERKKKTDSWVVEFGNNYKGQVASVLMFSLINEYGNFVQTGWQNVSLSIFSSFLSEPIIFQVIECIRNLFLHSLLPSNLLEAECFVKNAIKIPKIPLPDSALQKIKENSRRDGNGILSTLTQFLSLSSASYQGEYEEPDSTANEIEAESVSFECIKACHVEALFLDSRLLEEKSLKLLVVSLINASKEEGNNSSKHSASYLTPNKNMNKSGSKVSYSSLPEKADDKIEDFNSSAIFFYEVLMKVAIQNRDRINVIWGPIKKHICLILSKTTQSHVLLIERVVAGCFRLILRMIHNVTLKLNFKDVMLNEIFAIVELFKHLNLEDKNYFEINCQLMAGINQVVKTDFTVFCTLQRWDLILEFLSRTCSHPGAGIYSFEIASFLVSNQASEVFVNSENFGECVDLLISFASAAGSELISSFQAAGERFGSSSPNGFENEADSSSFSNPNVMKKAKSSLSKNPVLQGYIERAIQALDNLFKLHGKIPELIGQTGIGSERGQQCYHPNKEVRQHALTYLQRALLLPELERTTLDCSVDCFDNVLFPLLDELLKDEVCRLDPFGMDETRMRGCGLLCKIFLHYLSRLQGNKEELARSEGVRESLKNMLLVMSTQEEFKIPDHEDNFVWDLTWKHLVPWLPNIKEELFGSSNNVRHIPPNVELSASDQINESNEVEEGPNTSN